MADEQKLPLRKLYGRLRARMSRAQAQELSIAIQRRALELGCYRTAAAVALYAPVGNEVATGLIAQDALSSARRLFYPRIEAQAGLMRMIEVRDLDELRPGSLGIAQPQGEVELPPDLLPHTVIFVPGVAFGPRGERLGRGGGYYDRFLNRPPRLMAAVGLAYSWQLVPELPEQAWDQRMDYIVTELAVSALAARAAGAGSEKGGVPR